ncbi:hypothetical protein [Endozoicomonas sp. GU-1]|uniref:hypothetical protein n=1 Tax=Endozoicomonas sp. GU-1 TaxID=3009078 RepID=UPI0022B5A92A|nr:hypothetical protein [Endozoicomonas sp. GU-1]WBA83826.1 hypothetical protein O2T12_12250 [Endozoicomonas sp. GU-1]WBA86804.1 hypothetical protein O3276_01805 [Endozoicomonas sp. GU-1]
MGEQHALLETAMKENRLVFTEIAQYPEVWAVLFGDIHESQILVTASFNLSGAENTMAVCVDQDRYDQSWMIGILAKVVILLLYF